MNRTDILNTLVSRYGYESYLEIGVHNGWNFQAITARDKIGVDPDPASAATDHITSDAFFAANTKTFDLIFIDGLHIAEQVDKDIENSLKILNKCGMIVMHDCNPPDEAIQKIPQPHIDALWTGDVWKSVARLRMTEPNLSVYVIDTDWGVGVVHPGKQNLFPYEPNLTYDFLDRNRARLLNLVSPDAWLSIISG